MAEVTDTLERRDALRAIAATLRGDGIEVEFDVVPARWSIAGAHEFVIPGADPKRRLKARFRVTTGPVEDVEQELADLLETPEGIGRNEIKAFAKRVKAAVKGSDQIQEATDRIDIWVESVAERAAAFGQSWRPQAFSDDLARVLGFGGRT
ncbi:MAG TPA: helicase, partial [Skermanella sp.]|nr:helicase [Skermanella sp.]